MNSLFTRADESRVSSHQHRLALPEVEGGVNRKCRGSLTQGNRIGEIIT